MNKEERCWRGLNRNEIIEVCRLSSGDIFISKRKQLVVDAFFNLELRRDLRIAVAFRALVAGKRDMSD